MRYLLVLAMLCCAAGNVFGQTLGSITGDVKDPSGAVAPNVKITVRNTATNASRSTVTNHGYLQLPGP